MRTRLVIWGTNAEDEKVLLGISLNVDAVVFELYGFSPYAKYILCQ